MKLLKFFLAFFLTAHCYAQLATGENDFEMITSDIDAFWKAFDAFKLDTASNPFETYLETGTAGLKELKRSVKDAGAFKKIIKAEMDYYERIRPGSYDVLTYREKIARYYSSFRSIYPPAAFPDIYFCVGQFDTGATANATGIMVGIEMFADSAYQNSKGFKPTPVKNIPVIMAICLAYFNHRPAHTGYTLLRQSILQGSAEFLATLIVGEADASGVLMNERFSYGQQYEEMLVKEFLKKKNDNDFSGWLYEGKKSGERPADMGAWIGYRITEAYYHSMPDKVKAIDDILKINDFEKFLQLSGYAEPFRY